MRKLMAGSAQQGGLHTLANVASMEELRALPEIDEPSAARRRSRKRSPKQVGLILVWNMLSIVVFVVFISTFNFWELSFFSSDLFWPQHFEP